MNLSSLHSAGKPMVGRTAKRGAMLFCLLLELWPKVRQAICDCAQIKKNVLSSEGRTELKIHIMPSHDKQRSQERSVCKTTNGIEHII
ncbi:hypothetical protein D0T84_18100 [Dysgonomonas sp. 521]|nr:hypothetical protein [Dysgonomonas sp. 521]